MKEYPSQNFLNECFDYNISTGILYWKNERPITHFANEGTCKKWHTQYSNKEAGRIKKENDTLSYKGVKIQGSEYYVHIIVWIMVYGYQPTLIDHIDGNGINNILSNLRECTSTKNSRKSKISSRNSTGIKGVRLTPSGKYQVDASIDNKSIGFGTYDNIEYAARIYSTVAYIISGENFNEHKHFPEDTDEYKFVENKINSKRFHND